MSEFQRALDFIERASSVTSLDALRRELFTVFEALGVPHFSICAMLPDPAAGEAPVFTVLISGTPPAWSNYYRAQKFFNADAVIHLALKRPGSFSWSEVENARLPQRSARMFDEVRAAMPIRGGYAIPVHNEAGFAGIIALYGEDRELTPKAAQAVRLIGLFALEKAKALYLAAGPKAKAAAKCPLSQRQREILAYAASGMSETDTAAVLGLSSFTVREHMLEVRRKLDVRTKTQAVALAVHRGWVLP